MEPQANVLTVDLEDWFVIEALSGRYRDETWTTLPSTVEKNCERLLLLFHRKKAQATWFVLGWVAEQFPDLIRTIAQSGHEIACHSYRHRPVYALTEAEFKQDTERCVEAISKAIGSAPLGYRAPSWSINSDCIWAIKALAKMGFKYDSSIFPIKHDIYGMPDAPRDLYKMKFDDLSIYELPASTLQFFGQNLPLGGGGYLRHSPYWYTKMMINKINKSRRPAIVYVHPWEIDPDLPRIPNLSAVQRYRLYGSVDTLEDKMERLLDDFIFMPVWDYIRLATKGPIGFERSDIS